MPGRTAAVHQALVPGFRAPPHTPPEKDRAMPLRRSRQCSRSRAIPRHVHIILPGFKTPRNLIGKKEFGLPRASLERNVQRFAHCPGVSNKKARALSSTGPMANLNPAASYSSIRRPYSTIGAGGLNGRVRDGIGCDTSAIATGKRRSLKRPAIYFVALVSITSTY